ncbi:unnamed protein product [Amoebophrya sp. A25]|nr:unnamed protein product [Amoebophrya sp. A25]|eukprot:GSA25T00001404001.1
MGAKQSGERSVEGAHVSGARKSWNLYENDGAKDAFDIVDLDKFYKNWENNLLPAGLRSSIGGLQDSYPGILGEQDGVKIPSRLPVDYCSRPATCTVFLKVPGTREAQAELKLNERMPLHQLQHDLTLYFSGLLSLGYRHIDFKVIRPFVEVAFVSPGAATGGYDIILKEQMKNSEFPSDRDAARVLYWAVAIEGSVNEIADELASWKKQIQSGIEPRHVLDKMKKKKMSAKMIKEVHQFALDYKANAKKRGRRKAARELGLNWSYRWVHEAAKVGTRQTGGNRPSVLSPPPAAATGREIGGRSRSVSREVGQSHRPPAQQAGENDGSWLLRNGSGFTTAYAVRDMFLRLLQDEELEAIRVRIQKKAIELGSDEGAAAFVAGWADLGEEEGKQDKPPPIPDAGVSPEVLLPFLTVEKVENDSVKDFLQSALVSMVRDKPGRMVRCLKIASDLLARSIALDDSATQRIFFGMDRDQRELFVIGAKQRLRDLYVQFDNGQLERREFGHKVESMAQQITHFIDTVVLPCLTFFDVTLEIRTREDLALLGRNLDHNCFVTEKFELNGEEFSPDDFVKAAGAMRNARQQAAGVLTSLQVEAICVAEIRKQEAAKLSYVDGPETTGNAGGEPGGGGPDDISTEEDTASGTSKGSSSKGPVQKHQAGTFMLLEHLLSRTEIPSKIVMTKVTSETNRELVAKWVGWKADWFRYLCCMALHHDRKQILKNSILARYCYTESLRLASSVLTDKQVSYESIVTRLNFAVYYASVERDYRKAALVAEKAVKIVDRASSFDDPELYTPRTTILVQNLYRLQRTLCSHVVVMSVTISDWDVLSLLRDAGDSAVGNEPEGDDDDARGAAPKLKPLTAGGTTYTGGDEEEEDGSSSSALGTAREMVQIALDDNQRAGGSLWRDWANMCCGLSGRQEELAGSRQGSKDPPLPGKARKKRIDQKNKIAGLAHGRALPGMPTAERAGGTARREFNGYDAGFVARALVGSVHEKKQTFRPPCRLKIVCRLLIWIIRRRHIYAVKRWLREPRMLELGKDFGVWWVDHVDKDANYPGRRYYIACRLNTLFLESEEKKVEPFMWIGNHLSHRNSKRYVHNSELGTDNSPSHADQIQGKAFAGNPSAAEDLLQCNVILSKADVLGSIPFAEVHQFFRGLDNDRIVPKERFFSLSRFLDEYCRAWAFVAGRGRKGQVDTHGQPLRNLSVRRHPIRALHSGPE